MNVKRGYPIVDFEYGIRFMSETAFLIISSLKKSKISCIESENPYVPSKALNFLSLF